MDDTFILTVSPLSLSIRWQGGLVRSLSVSWENGESEPPQQRAPGDALHARILRTLERYVEGETVRWPALPLDMAPLTPFSRAVLTSLKDNVPHGQVVSYGHLAAMAGYPRAARAVGRVMNTSPFALVVPCHRVVGADGSMVGYGSSGLAMKRWLLRLEGVLEEGRERIPRP